MEKYISIRDIKHGMKNIVLICIVLDVGKPTKTKEGHEVRTCRVADKSGSINISVWDEWGQLIQGGDIIKICRGYTAYWKGFLTIYTGRGGYIERMGDFCMVYSENPNISETITENPQQQKLPSNADQQHSQLSAPQQARTNSNTSSNAAAAKTPQPANSTTVTPQHRPTRSQIRGSQAPPTSSASPHQAYPVISNGQNNTTNVTTVNRPRPRMTFSNIPR
ncbi:SOSS complex subunit B2 [Trichoplax sp. H2]|nr:SOSS complex subunit B2 [Trichoplax sp. H2]|eukprot:RDD41024.1 SOSS complex subunit B2 [Trichoplax sp. H2]